MTAAAPDSSGGSIRLRGFGVAFDTRTVLEIPRLDFARGSYTLITGPTGCGKSSFALALAGVLEEMTGASVSGSITADGAELLRAASAERGRRVAAVWQHAETQLFRRTLIDEVRAGLDFQLIGVEEGDTAARAALRLVGLDHLDESRDPLSLSGGEQQRLALAATMVLRTPILVLDEATSQLDRAASERFSTIISEARSLREMTVIAFDHRPDPHLGQADRVIVLTQRGSIALDGTPAAVYGREAARCREIGVRLPAGASAADDPVERDTPVPAQGGRPQPAEKARPALSLSGVNVARPPRSGREPLLDRASFALPEGSICMLVGPNGSGKSTLLNTLAGAQQHARGGIVPSLRERRARGIGYAPQRGSELMFASTVRDELGLSLPSGARHEARGGTGRAADEWLDRAGLLHLADIHPQHLSGGQRQRLSVLLAAASAPALLLLDEPTNAQDLAGTARILDLVGHGAGHRVTMIASHEEAEFRGIATHRIELRHGIVGEVQRL